MRGFYRVERTNAGFVAGGVHFPPDALKCAVQGIIFVEWPEVPGDGAACANCNGWGYVYARQVSQNSYVLFCDEDRRLRGDLIAFRCPKCGG